MIGGAVASVGYAGVLRSDPADVDGTLDSGVQAESGIDLVEDGGSW